MDYSVQRKSVPGKDLKMDRPPSVLIVEDEAAMALALQVRMRTGGFAVCGTASSKAEAVDLALEHRPDVILMDIRLTGEGDGIEAAQEIQQTMDTQIIFMTGYSEGEVKKRAMALNPAAYMVKPFSLAELLSVVTRSLEPSTAGGKG
jgi:CheY-like chemotaxis protein